IGVCGSEFIAMTSELVGTSSLEATCHVRVVFPFATEADNKPILKYVSHVEANSFFPASSSVAQGQVVIARVDNKEISCTQFNVYEAVYEPGSFSPIEIPAP